MRSQALAVLEAAALALGACDQTGGGYEAAELADGDLRAVDPEAADARHIVFCGVRGRLAVERRQKPPDDKRRREPAGLFPPTERH